MRRQTVGIEMQMLNALHYVQIEAVYQRFDAIVVVTSIQQAKTPRSSLMSRHAVEVEVRETASDKALPIVFWVLNAPEDLIVIQPYALRQQIEYYSEKPCFMRMEQELSPKKRMLMHFFKDPADKAICLFKRIEEARLLDGVSGTLFHFPPLPAMTAPALMDGPCLG